MTTYPRVCDSFNRQSLMSTLGASLASIADGEVSIELPFSDHLSQQHGFTHAGAIASIADSACGYAAMTRVAGDQEVVTAEFKINFLRPARGDRFIAVGRVLHAGRQLTVCAGEVRAFSGSDSSHKVVAVIQATIATVSTNHGSAESKNSSARPDQTTDKRDDKCIL